MFSLWEMLLPGLLRFPKVIPKRVRVIFKSSDPILRVPKSMASWPICEADVLDRSYRTGFRVRHLQPLFLLLLLVLLVS